MIDRGPVSGSIGSFVHHSPKWPTGELNKGVGGMLGAPPTESPLHTQIEQQASALGDLYSIVRELGEKLAPVSMTHGKISASTSGTNNPLSGSEIERLIGENTDKVLDLTKKLQTLLDELRV